MCGGQVDRDAENQTLISDTRVWSMFNKHVVVFPCADNLGINHLENVVIGHSEMLLGFCRILQDQ